jgi:ABC-type Zn uptake system ZnuABC Zn-binding protein ZnuA
MRRLLVVVLLVMASLAVAACGSASGGSLQSSNPDAPLQVVATTTVLTDFAKVIGGDRVGVYGILKPNVDPHDYEPAPADLDAIAHADVIVKNGVGLEEWLDDTIRSSGTAATVADTSEGITVRDLPASDHAAGQDHGDPHIWHDPRNATRMVTTIAAAFTAADPEGASTYAANLASYSAALASLDNDIATEIATLSNKKLVTNHDAFGYFVDHYGLTFVGSIIPSFDTSAELSASDLRTLVSAIKAEGVKAVFSETSLPTKTAKAIAVDAGVKVVEGEDALYGDGLGPASSDGATYLTMMRHNANTIVSNLR